MGDIINIGDRAEFSGVVSELDNINRTINSAREMLSMFPPRERAGLIGQVAASEFCAYGGRNACRTLALNQLGEFVAEVVGAIDKAFPPADSEGFR
jgi:hypothetical protein